MPRSSTHGPQAGAVRGLHVKASVWRTAYLLRECLVDALQGLQQLRRNSLQLGRDRLSHLRRLLEVLQTPQRQGAQSEDRRLHHRSAWGSLYKQSTSSQQAYKDNRKCAIKNVTKKFNKQWQPGRSPMVLNTQRRTPPDTQRHGGGAYLEGLGDRVHGHQGVVCLDGRCGVAGHQVAVLDGGAQGREQLRPRARIAEVVHHQHAQLHGQAGRRVRISEKNCVQAGKTTRRWMEANGASMCFLHVESAMLQSSSIPQ